jgi:hypothetical protein
MAQWRRRSLRKRKIAGSIPARSIEIKFLIRFLKILFQRQIMNSEDYSFACLIQAGKKTIACY